MPALRNNFLSDAVLCQPGITPERHGDFRQAVERVVMFANSEFVPVMDRAGPIQQRFDRLADGCSLLRKGLAGVAESDVAGSGARAWLEMALWRRGSSLEAIEGVLEVLSSSVTSASTKSRAVLPTTGKPRGVSGFPKLKHFIELLIWEIDKAGAKATVDKERRGGTLILLLEDLRKELPKHFLPAPTAHPVSTYRSIIRRALDDRHKLTGGYRGQKGCQIRP